MQRSAQRKDIKTEMILAAFGLVMLVAVFVLQPVILSHSSPLALMVIASLGFLISLKFDLVGGIFLFIGGSALAVHPLMFSSSLWLIPGGAVTGFAGLLALINWWRQTDN